MENEFAGILNKAVSKYFGTVLSYVLDYRCAAARASTTTEKPKPTFSDKTKERVRIALELCRKHLRI
jgi:hypothetical protein